MPQATISRNELLSAEKGSVEAHVEMLAAQLGDAEAKHSRATSQLQLAQVLQL
jgi:hypothetical protein